MTAVAFSAVPFPHQLSLLIDGCLSRYALSLIVGAVVGTFRASALNCEAAGA
jgi:hypothetical protein